MFAMNPQSIVMPEGVTPVASTTAGAAAAGTAFAEVMGAVSPPAAAGAAPPAALILPTLAEPALTASLLAWPSDSLPANTTESPETAGIDAAWPMVDVLADGGVVLEVAVPSLVDLQVAVVEGVNLPPATPVPAFPVERPALAPLGSAAPQDQTETGVLAPQAAASSVAAAAQPALRPADNGTVWSGTAQTAPVNPGPQQGPIAKPTAAADATGTVLRPRNGPTPEQGTTKGDVAPRVPAQSADQTAAPIAGSAERPSLATERGADVQAVLRPAARTDSPAPNGALGSPARGERATTAPQIAPVQTVSPASESTQGPRSLARVAGATPLKGAVAERPQHESSAGVTAPRVARLAGGYTLADAPVAAEVQVPGPQGAGLKAPVNHGFYPTTARRQRDATLGPTGTKSATPPTATPLADTPSPDQTPVVLGGAKVAPGTVEQGRRDAEPAPRAAAPSLTVPRAAPPNGSIPNAEQVAPKTGVPPGRDISALPVQWQAVQKTTQPVQTVQGAPGQDLPETAQTTLGLGSAGPLAQDQPAAQIGDDQPVPNPAGSGQPDRAKPVQSLHQQGRSGLVQKPSAPALVSQPIADPVGKGDKAAGQTATLQNVPDRFAPISPDRSETVAAERPVWFGDRATRTVPAGLSARIDPAQGQIDAKPVIRTPIPIQPESVDPAQTRQIAPVTGAVRSPVPVMPPAPLRKTGDAPVPRAISPAEPSPVPILGPQRPVLPRPDTPVAQVFATSVRDKPAARTAPPPAVAPPVSGADQPQPTAAPRLDLPAPQPSNASFWQVPTASLGWQTALQFWTPAVATTKPPSRSAVPPSPGTVRTSPAPVQMDLAAPLKAGKPLQVDDRPTPGPVKDRVEKDTPATPIPTVVPPVVPAVVTATGPVFAAQPGQAERMAAAADSALPPISTTAPANLSAPLNMPPHLPKGLPESLTRAAKEERTELLLDPVELGKVRFELLTTGDKVQVNLSVERPETLDLLRRNMDSLSREFREAGFDASTLTFSQWGKGQDDGQQTAQTPQFGDDTDLPDIVTAPIAKPTRNTASQGLDLRL